MFAFIDIYIRYNFVEKDRVSENEEGEYKHRRELSMLYNTVSILPS